MARSEPEDKTDSPPSTAVTAATSAAWGTWEELLLAYAVNRYGTKSWDSISSELRKRSSDPIHLTPHHCEQKYGELKRRFNQSDVDDGGVTTANGGGDIPWLEELRKVRVLELQRELQNYDLYISSLQLKVKKLTEESEKNGSDLMKNSDLGHGNDEIQSEKPEEVKKDDSPEPPQAVASGEVSGGGEDSDRDNQSVNGSNGNLEIEEKPVSPVRTGEEKSEPAVLLSPVREEDSCNGRPDGGGTEPVQVKSEPDGEMKLENSDVQSSASKSRRKDRVKRGSTKTDGRENEKEEDDDQSTDSIPVRSLPLVDFLQKLHKLGSPVFERRLDRQEKLRYKNIIKQHIDYEILQTRLKEGWYSDGNDKFFRDLLLLVNNTRIFFPKDSPESVAAIDLRKFILKEMNSKKKQKTDSKVPDKSANLPPKRASDATDSLLLKPKLAGPIVVCRKRSSITAKAKEQTDSKNPEKLVDENRDSSLKKSRESSFSLMGKKKGKSVEKPEVSDTKTDKKKKLTEAEEKKQSAAKFLNRMKRSNNEPLINTLKTTPERGSGGGDGKKDQAAKKSSGGRQVKEQDSPAKRSVGRPPKRAAAPPSLSAGLGKRSRESTDSETLGSGSKQTKKRTKR